MRRLLPVCLIIGCLASACSDNSIYYWNGYDDQIYEYYKDKPPSELIEAMEAIKTRSEAQEKPLPPTFYAHLGLLYQKVGQTQKFRELALEEKNNYPESTSFINFLLKKKGG